MRQLVQASLLLVFCLSLSRAQGPKISAQEPKIVGGYAVPSMEGFGHVASLRVTQFLDSLFYGYGHLCGASLINSTAVLTAAHCVYDDETNQYYPASLFSVTMGSLWRNDSSNLVIPVARIVGHANYNKNTFANDIAVLILNQAVPSSHPTASPIRLPTESPTVGQTCIISGWGNLYFDGPSALNLVAANVTINSRADCNLPTRYGGLVLPEMFCAGPFTGGIDSCQGDSGGPLFCGDTLVGIVSNGFECARPNYPGIYTSVYNYTDWVLGITTQTSTTSTTTGDSSSIAGSAIVVLLSAIAAISGLAVRL